MDHDMVVDRAWFIWCPLLLQAHILLFFISFDMFESILAGLSVFERLLNQLHLVACFARVITVKRVRYIVTGGGWDVATDHMGRRVSVVGITSLRC